MSSVKVNDNNLFFFENQFQRTLRRQIRVGVGGTYPDDYLHFHRRGYADNFLPTTCRWHRVYKSH